MTLAAVIPCAGTSSRMGMPKALLDAGGGESFLARSVRILTEAGCDPVFVVLSGGDGVPVDPHLSAEAEATGATVILNPDPSTGMRGSIRLAAKAAAQEAALLVLPVDHPTLQAETVRAVVEAGDVRSGVGHGGGDGSGSPPAREGDWIVAPVHAGTRGHPVIFGPAVVPELRGDGSEGRSRHGARAVVARVPDRVELVEVSDPGVVEDVDTPERYQALLGKPPRVVAEAETPPRPRFRAVHIHYQRPPDRKDVYEQLLVADLTDVKITYQASTPVPRPVEVGGRVILEPGSPVVWFTFPGVWHDIGRFHDAAGRFTGVYSNVLTPCVIHPTPGDLTDPIRWDTTDLYLDVWIGAGESRPQLLDEDDLRDALNAGHLTPEMADAARREADRILNDIGLGSWPPPVVEAWPLERVRSLGL